MRSTLIVLLLAASFTACSDDEITAVGLPSAADFVWKDSAFCTQQRSSTKRSIGYVFTLSGLTSEKPSATFQSGNATPLEVAFQDEGIITLQQIAWATGSVDTIIVDKRSGTFTRTETGASYAIASVGSCR
jgi:hypothetical protein